MSSSYIKKIQLIVKELGNNFYLMDTFKKGDTIEKHLKKQLNNYDYVLEFYKFLMENLFPFLKANILNKYNNELAWRITDKGITLFVSREHKNDGKYLGIDLNTERNLNYEYFSESFSYNKISYSLLEFENIKPLIIRSYQNKVNYIKDPDLLQSNNNISNKLENKIARICWNSNGWKFPSGPVGKSNYEESFESLNGFGFEEWLFDRRKIINGFHYAFLQPLHLKSNIHVGKKYNISLITVLKSENLNKFYVGKIKNAECISPIESEKIYNVYKQKDWLKDMIGEIENFGGDGSIFKNINPKEFVNVKFKFKDLIELNELEKISDDDENVNSLRYNLLPQKSAFLIETEREIANHNYRNTSRRKRVYKGECEFEPYHAKMQNFIYDILKQDPSYITEQVYIEKDRVDLKAQTRTGEWHFFEIKTDSPKLSIRKDLGQIMEYTFFPNEKRAQKMFIISDTPPNREVKSYLQLIRNNFNIPIYYKYFDFETEQLYGEY